VKDGVCGLFIAEKARAVRRAHGEASHLRILAHAGLVRGKKRIRQWTFYKRDEKRISEVKKEFRLAW